MPHADICMHDITNVALGNRTMSMYASQLASTGCLSQPIHATAFALMGRPLPTLVPISVSPALWVH